jgi:hypothetical protein
MSPEPLRVNGEYEDLSVRTELLTTWKRPAYAQISINLRSATRIEDSNRCRRLAGRDHIISSQADVGSRR